MNAPFEAEVVKPLGLADLLSAEHVDAMTDARHAMHEAEAQAHYASTCARDLLEVGSLHAQSLRQTFEGLAAAQSRFAESAAACLSGRGPGDLAAYAIDAWQRGVLFLDILRRRGNNFVQHEEAGCPPVLAYDYDVVVDGSTLERPVNYTLVAIRPPAGTTTRPNARPYVIIDPRAGHGSGIGGFKSESEVGVALRAGHPVYFCVFTTHPTPGQTLADVTRAEAHFVRAVQNRHPDSPRPVIIGNCQGGWAAMLLAATNTDLTGPIVINGTPLSYWAGKRGRNPMRYLGGLAGGVVPAMLAADLGNGLFDGANLVQNFENLDPGHALFRKYYDVFAATAAEGERYLEFERWWSGFYFMNEAEIRWIVENLFVGNRPARGGAQLDPRLHADLRNVRAPVIVFASHGDHITPPAQALAWITDVFSSVQDIKARGQRIVYTVHDSIGHLGIFVSASVAKKEHREIVSTLEAIEAMAPGLYEMRILEETGEDHEKRFAIEFEERTLDDIRALGDPRDDEQAFAAVARLSRLGAEAYSLALRPLVRAMTNEAMAHWRVQTQPQRLRRYLMSDRNPLVAPLAPLAAQVRAARQPAAPDNAGLACERAAADLVTQCFDSARDLRDAWIEASFFAIYSSPALRAIGATEPPLISEVPGTDLRSVPEVRAALAQIGRGNAAVGTVRMLVLLARSRGSVSRDRLARANELLTTQEPFTLLDETARTRILHQQTMIVEFEPERALAALPKLLPTAAERLRALEQCDFVMGPDDEGDPETRALQAEMRRLLEVADTTARKPRARRVRG